MSKAQQLSLEIAIDLGLLAFWPKGQGIMKENIKEISRKYEGNMKYFKKRALMNLLS